MIPVADIRRQFPILARSVNGSPLVYFDNAATTHKPQPVIDAIVGFYTHSNSNIHRGVHTLSREATVMYETARRRVADHFHVKNDQQIVFTAGTTDSINLVAQSLAAGYLKEGDEIIVSAYEHHSNLLPWQLWAQRHGGKLRVIRLSEDHGLAKDEVASLINPRTKLIAVAHVSNTLGVISDLGAIVSLAAKKGVPVMVDGAQAAPHMPVDIPALGVDFYACSAHKIYGPTGTGMLYLSERWLKELAQARTGGGAIKAVTFDTTEYADGALRFEAGTPHISGVIGFAAALDYVDAIGMQSVFDHEHALVQYAQKKLRELPEVMLYGAHAKKAGVVSFNVKNHHPFDVGTLLDKWGIAVRTGHHCTQPLMDCLAIQGTVRASFAVYNTPEEVDFFVEKLKRAITMLG